MIWVNPSLPVRSFIDETEVPDETTAKGFTLVELLIVVGIIAVLISLLMPVVSRAREHSHLVGCMNNQKQNLCRDQGVRAEQ